MNENETRVGYAFVPEQEFKQVLQPEEALCKGTVFPELYLPMEVYGPKLS